MYKNKRVEVPAYRCCEYPDGRGALSPWGCHPGTGGSKHNMRMTPAGDQELRCNLINFDLLKRNLKGSLPLWLRAFLLPAKGSISIPALHYLRKIEYEPTSPPHCTDKITLLINQV